MGEIRCARTADVCVVSASDQHQRVLYALDPAKGKGRELLRIGPASNPGSDSEWDLSPDGSSLAFIKEGPQERALQIQVRRLGGGFQREVNIGGWGSVGPYRFMAFIRWAADGKGWYVTAFSKNGSILLKVDPSGKAKRLLRESTWSDAIPSPDGRHVALLGQTLTSNVWMLENF